MQLRARGTAAITLGTGVVFCLWAAWAHGVAVATAGLVSLVSLGLGLAYVRERRESAELERALGREKAHVRQVSDHAWQSAVLTQVVDELHDSPDESSVLEIATTALVRTLKASRAVVYRRAEGGWRVCAQCTSAGVPRLGEDSVLPAVLATDRDLAERLSETELSEESDPELRALAERLQVRSVVVLPLGQDRILGVHQCDAPRSWTETERRFIQRFADQVASALTRAEQFREQSEDAEVRAGLLRIARAFSGARESRVVVDIATSVGAPLARCRASAVLVDRDGYGFQVAGQHGFQDELSSSWVRSLETELEDCMRARTTVRIRPRDLATRCPELSSSGPLAIVPLFCGRESLGVLVLEKAPAAKSWPDRDLEIAETLAELTASALKNANLFEALTAAEARFADLYDNAPDLYQTIDPSGRILDCNRTQCSTLGYTKKDLVGRRFDGVLTKESVALWRAAQSELFDRGYVRDANIKLLARDGRSVDVLVNASVVLATKQQPLSARVVMRDVSEQRELEGQLRQRQKLEIVGSLAGGIAHDFNNVLGGILGYASLLKSDLRDRPNARKFVDTIERSAVRGAELTAQLLAASRRAPARREAINLNDVVEETLELLRHTFQERVRIGKRLDPRVRPILADASQLQQVVLNLCINARDAMPDGGSLRVETTFDESDAKLRLTVEDTGVGIEPTTIARVFEPFFSTKGEGGSGLGLSVVYDIVKSLGGDVRVKSSPGKGARFDIFVPAKWVEVEGPPPRVVEPARGRGELVLLVDDESVLRELGKEILEGHGYRVETVASGEDALSFIRDSRESVSVVILDLVMPGIDGGETFRRLRDVDTTIPVLLSSGLSSEEVVEEILAEGASGFIPKPYGIGELTRAVSLALDREDAGITH